MARMGRNRVQVSGSKSFPWGKSLMWLVVIVVLGGLAYLGAVLNWSYARGERAGYVQKFSNKGWLCKTWEGELSMVAMPGSMPEKFYFTVRDDAVAEKINNQMGKRVSLIYDQHVGIPSSCFGETGYFVSNVKVVD